MAGHLYLSGILRLLPRVRIPPMPAILDVGCGTGINLFESARRFAPARLLCGIDISPGMVEVARTKAASLGIPAHFTVGDAEWLPYADDQFDLVICNSVLHWFRDRSAAVREMARVLRPGGQLLLICAAAPGFGEWFDLMDALVRSVKGGPAQRSLPPLPTPVEVAGMLSAGGFRVDHLVNPSHVQRVTDFPRFVRLMSTVAPHWAADLSPAEQEQLEQMAVTVMRTGWPGGFPSTWAAIEAVATRAT